MITFYYFLAGSCEMSSEQSISEELRANCEQYGAQRNLHTCFLVYSHISVYANNSRISTSNAIFMYRVVHWLIPHFRGSSTNEFQIYQSKLQVLNQLKFLKSPLLPFRQLLAYQTFFSVRIGR